MTDSNFRVIIVGSSVAGLTLAHCLQQANISHVVLEQGDDVAPQVGASIGILQNGARILDQLDLYKHVGELVEPVEMAHIVYPDGFSFSSRYPQILEQRLKFLEILYRTYPDKSNILLNKKVVEVRLLGKEACVVTEDGSTYTGKLVVGADGVHSCIRSEMWRLADMNRPGLITQREKTSSCMKTEYACIFGISSPIDGLKPGEQVDALYDGFTVITIHGKGGRIFWFMIKKMKKKFTYPDRPRFSPEVAERVVASIGQNRLWGNIKVKDIWDRKEVASMTPLEENVFSTWYYNRMVLVGDSVHKMTPNFGQGANCAIEDAALLASLLQRAVHGDVHGDRTQHDLSGLEEIDSLLRLYQQKRYSRVKSIYRQSRAVARLHSRNGLVNILIGRYYAPYAGDLPANITSKAVADAEVLRYIPVCQRTGPGWSEYGSSQRTNLLPLWVMSIIVAIIVLWLRELVFPSIL
ncbi:FAD binding monooxygenase [Paecilomyces variotii No. 5]|uniref:FAD binding monooxygenase n=1 Tax=Byssochlamys spectabilis (strain No. 5 / NBRC 109023) TaxID=1356009 RepID=V5FNA5_BYSSN|nr:FAD binding monooxygenase [Paecilomyces variotii No. 5]